MRLTVKLTCALMLVIIVFMSVQAARNTRRFTALHMKETRDELLVLAATLGAAVDEIYRSSGPVRAAEYVRAESRRRADTTISLTAGKNERPVAATSFAAMPVAERATFVRDDGVALTVRLAIGGALLPPATLALSHSLAPHRAYVARVVRQQIMSTAVLSLLCGVALLALGITFIGRPVKLLLDQARTVADGDFSLRVAVRQADEIGDLAREMNRMSERLESAWDQAHKERRARTTALAELRHADRLSTVGKIASGIAHELGTPLNVVSGRAMMIAAAPGCTDDIASDARIIAEQAQHMTQIIRQLLDFARRRPLHRRTTDVGRLVEHASLLVEPLADEHGVTIERPAAVDIVAAIDEDKALQVLTNLMINGIQAMPGGGRLLLSIAVESVAAPPDDHAAPGIHVRLSITDEGVGIDEGALRHIFEPFFTTKGAGEGTGLGLSVCHGIVREHGGWIAVTSAPGSGSTFSVYFPQGDEV